MADENDIKDNGAEGTEGKETEAKFDPLVELRKLNDTISNMKSEFNRKIDGIKPVAPTIPQPRVEKKSLKDLWYEDEEAAFQEIENRVTQKFETQLAKKDQRAMTAGELVREFPEVSDKSHELTKRANEIFAGFSEEDASSPLAMKTAVNQAALELGVRPMSKRPKQRNDDDDDNFSLGGNRGGSEPRSGSKRSKSAVTADMVEAAQLFGLNTEDPKVMKRLEERAQRSNYKKYQ